MSDVTRELKHAKIELGKRLGLVLEDPAVISRLKDSYRRHLKQEIAPGADETSLAFQSAQAILQQYRQGGNPIQNIIDVALTGRDAVTRGQAEEKLRQIAQMPDVHSTGVVASRRAFEVPKFQ
ncbi:MAG: hypothetical protein WBK91_02130 [Alphaproteobacteria bacterium]